MATNSELETLAQKKADEIIYRQKVQELSSAVTEVIRVLPNSLHELRYAIEILDKNNERDKLKTKEASNKTLEEIRNLKGDIDKLFDKLREVEPQKNSSILKLIDKNDNNSLINIVQDLSRKLESLVSDMNNDKSIARMIDKKIEELKISLIDLNNEKSLLSLSNKNTKSILKEITDKNNIRAFITWGLMTIISILTILSSLGIIGKK